LLCKCSIHLELWDVLLNNRGSIPIQQDLHMRTSLLVFPLALAVGGLLSGCAATQKAFDAMKESNQRAQAQDAAAFPDPALMAGFATPGGQPAGAYTCNGCQVFLKGPYDKLDFLTIDRDAGRVHDVRDLARQISLEPIERSDVGRIFMDNAQRRGNTLGIYGPAVNHRIIDLARPRQSHSQNGRLLDDLSSTIIEFDRDGAFVAILAARYEVSRGVIVTDSPDAQNLFVHQRVVVLPYSTARFIQERMPAGFIENYRIR